MYDSRVVTYLYSVDVFLFQKNYEIQFLHDNNCTRTTVISGVGNLQPADHIMCARSFNSNYFKICGKCN